MTPLTLCVVPTKCAIDQQTNYDIIAGGHTLPIFFDFKNCLPMTGVTLSGNVTDYTTKTLAAESISFSSAGDAAFSVDFKLVPSADPM